LDVLLVRTSFGPGDFAREISEITERSLYRSEGLTQMAWQRSDDQSWSGTLLAGGPVSATFQSVTETPLWSSTFDIRLADEEEEGEVEEDEEDDDEADVEDEELDDEDFDDEEFEDEFDDDDDLDDDDDDEEEEEEEEDEDY
jgi:hypothetical protein